jgi:hypothetical protein
VLGEKLDGIEPSTRTEWPPVFSGMAIYLTPIEKAEQNIDEKKASGNDQPA